MSESTDPGSSQRPRRLTWLIGLGATLLIIVAPIVVFLPGGDAGAGDPWAFVPAHLPETDHTDLMPGPYESGQDVTRACSECHPDAAGQVMGTTHWTWLDQPVTVPGREQPVALGKANAINNFCIGVQSNWPGCTSCHAGYGWEDEGFDFTTADNVDCLVCHDNSGQYVKGDAGVPVEGVDLTVAARSVGGPSRTSCGSCHFKGGGGDAVKHGDLDTSLAFPTENIDVHMGAHGFLCTDCHQTQDHVIRGRAASVSLDQSNSAACTDCHQEDLHADDRIDAHVDALACQTCHIPTAAIKEATKVHWDWSQAGQDREEDGHQYLKIKGSFIYERAITPEYEWWNGTVWRYLLGDPVVVGGETPLNSPLGSIDDPQAKIWPFKIHRAVQIYDPVNGYLLQPKTVGEGGYWADFDWDQAVRLGSEVVGLDYSGTFDWTDTAMHWPITHMVQPSENALECMACHGEGGRMDWTALGYDGDPMFVGGRDLSGAP